MISRATTRRFYRLRRSRPLDGFFLHLYSWRRHRAGAARDQTIVLDAPMATEVEDRLLAETGSVEIAGVHQEFVCFGSGLDDDFSARINDKAATDQGEAIFHAGFCDAHDPRRVLVRAGLRG